MDGRQRTSPATAEAIAQATGDFVSALERGDAGAASAMYADDASLLPPSAELLRGRGTIEAFWKAGIESGIKAVELESLELVPHGPVAYEVGRYAFRLEPADGEPVLDRGKYLLVHALQSDGSWRRAVEMFNPDTPPARVGGSEQEA